MIPNDPQDPAVYKLVGSIIGAVLSLIFIKPVNLRDAIGRSVFSATCGYFFAFWIVEYFNWPQTEERWIAAAIICSGFSWLFAGLGVRVIRGANKIPK